MGNLTAIMSVLTATSTVTEAIVKYEDGSLYVAYERACGTVGLRRVTLGDFKRLPLVEGQPDTGDGEGEIAISVPVMYGFDGGRQHDATALAVLAA